MSGDPMQEVHEKKIVRFIVSWLRDGGVLNRSKQFKCSLAATRCRNQVIKGGVIVMLECLRIRKYIKQKGFINEDQQKTAEDNRTGAEKS